MKGNTNEWQPHVPHTVGLRISLKCLDSITMFAEANKCTTKNHLKINRMPEVCTYRANSKPIDDRANSYRCNELNKYLPVDLSPSWTLSPLVIIDARIRPSIGVCH